MLPLSPELEDLAQNWDLQSTPRSIPGADATGAMDMTELHKIMQGIHDSLDLPYSSADQAHDEDPPKDNEDKEDEGSNYL